MDYNELLIKLEQYRKIKDQIPKSAIESYENSFNIDFAHDSTAIEGNTLTRDEVAFILNEVRLMDDKK